MFNCCLISLGFTAKVQKVRSLNFWLYIHWKVSSLSVYQLLWPQFSLSLKLFRVFTFVSWVFVIVSIQVALTKLIFQRAPNRNMSPSLEWHTHICTGLISTLLHLKPHFFFLGPATNRVSEEHGEDVRSRGIWAYFCQAVCASVLLVFVRSNRGTDVVFDRSDARLNFLSCPAPSFQVCATPTSSATAVRSTASWECAGSARCASTTTCARSATWTTSTTWVTPSNATRRHTPSREYHSLPPPHSNHWSSFKLQ